MSGQKKCENSGSFFNGLNFKIGPEKNLVPVWKAIHKVADERKIRICFRDASSRNCDKRNQRATFKQKMFPDLIKKWKC